MGIKIIYIFIFSFLYLLISCDKELLNKNDKENIIQLIEIQKNAIRAPVDSLPQLLIKSDYLINQINDISDTLLAEHDFLHASLFLKSKKIDTSIFYLKRASNYTKDTIQRSREIKYFQVLYDIYKKKGDFLNGLNQLAIKEKDSFTRKWINAKIIMFDTRSSITYVHLLPNDYINSTLCKAMIFSEFILPYYDKKKKIFTFNNK